MKILKRILLGIVIIIALVLITAAFTKKEYALEREIIIDKPSTQVFSYVKYLKNHDHYNKWVMTDPDMKKEFKGTDGQPGFIYYWNSDMKNVGEGEQEIKSINEGKNVDYEIRFVRPWEGVANSSVYTEPLAENKTRVKWTFGSKMPYPMNFMLLFMDMDDTLGPDLQTTLQNLKTVLEKQ